MAHTKSAKKSYKKSLVVRASNRASKATIRNVAKKVHTQLAAKDIAGAEDTSKLLTKKLDQLVAKKVFHKNTASRMKSRLSAAIVRVKKPAAAAK
jgi:small subunit ribosomal protein S20